MKYLIALLLLPILSGCTKEPTDAQILAVAEKIVQNKHDCSKIAKTIDRDGEIFKDPHGSHCALVVEGKMPIGLSFDEVRAIDRYLFIIEKHGKKK